MSVDGSLGPRPTMLAEGRTTTQKEESVNLTRRTDDRESLHLALMLALTFSTGVVDAVGFLGLDRVFTANMTGNIVILGMGITGADNLPVVGPFVALMSFIAGATLAGATMRRAGSGWTRRFTTLLAIVALLIGAAAVPISLPAGTWVPWMLLSTGLLGGAMGLQAGAARHIAVPDLTTVVVTSALVALAYESPLGKRTPQRWVRRAAALVALVAGAAAGALLLNVGPAWGMSLAALVTAGVAAIGAVRRT